MADAKIYVEIHAFQIGTTLNSNRTLAVPFSPLAIHALIVKKAEAAIGRAGKLTLQKPKDAGAKGWSLNGKFDLELNKAGDHLDASIDWFVAVWPTKAIKLKGTDSKSVAIEQGKPSDGNLRDAISGAMDDVMATAVSFMSKPPQ